MNAAECFVEGESLQGIKTQVKKEIGGELSLGIRAD